MSRSWNGEDLTNELAELLGDTSTPFKNRVLGWLNDVIFDISTRHDWGYHLTRGKKMLMDGMVEHNLEITPPGAPDVALALGGELSENTIYKTLVTFIQANGVESIAGEQSLAVTTDATNKSIILSNIPTTLESTVTKRRIYLKKGTGAFCLHTTLSDNFETDLTITTDTTSTIEAPDYEAIRLLKGAPFFEDSPSVQLRYRDEDQLRLLVQGQWTPGNPEFFSVVDGNKIVTYPPPSSDMELSFNYYRYPKRLYFDEDSQPDLPINLKPALKAGVIYYGYEYRDRDGTEIKKANYENALNDAITKGSRVSNIEYVVKDVYGSFNGFEVG